MLATKFQKFNPVDRDKNKNYATAEILESTTTTGKTGGNLLLVLEIEMKPELAKKIAEIILEILKRTYYEKTEIAPVNYPTSGEYFEKALNKVNQALSTLAAEGYIDWINKTHVVLAVIDQNKLHFSSVGQVKVFLRRQKNLININQATEHNQPTPLKTFTNIISGDLRRDDQLLFITPQLLKIIPENKLREILTKDSAPTLLKKLSVEYNHYQQLANAAAIAVDLQEKPETENLLASSLTTVKKNNESDLANQLEFPILTETSAKQSSPSTTTVHRPSSTSRPNKKSEKKSWRPAVMKLVEKTTRFFSKMMRAKNKRQHQAVNNFSARRPLLPPQPLSLRLRNLGRKTGHNFLTRFRRLPRSSQILAIAALVLALLFTGSIIVIIQKKKEINKLSQHEILLDRAISKEKEAADALIYNDKAKARELLQEAQAEAEKLIAAKVLTTEAENLLVKIKEQMDKVSGITRVDDALTLAELDKKQITELIGLKDKIYAFDRKTNLIYGLDEENKTLTALSEESNNVGYFQSATADETNDLIYLLTDSPSLAQFSVTKKTLENLTIEIFNQEQTTKELVFYGDKLYRLVPEAQQIFKHTKTIAGFSKGGEWLTSTEDLSNAQSLAVDGFIYVLKADGTINKYLRGTKQNFALATIADPLVSPSKIFTAENLENLYIIDPPQKRILAFSKKNGALVAQFQAESFVNLQDVFVNTAEKKMYVLTGEKILGVVLEIKAGN